jgi:hypothetical protein
MVLLGIDTVLSISEIPHWIVYTIMYIGLILFAVGGFGVALF